MNIKILKDIILFIEWVIHLDKTMFFPFIFLAFYAFRISIVYDVFSSAL